MDQKEASRLSTSEVWQLVKRVQAGDTDAFDPIFRRYHQQIYVYLYYRTKTVAVAEDLTSEVFLRAFKYIQQFNDRGVDFGAVLYRIASNALKDHVKSGAYQRTVAFDPQAHDNPSPDRTDVFAINSLVGTMMEEYVWTDLLCGLSAPQRECVLLYYRDGIGLEEIARVLGVARSAVNSRLSRARDVLRKHPLAWELRSYL